MGLTVQTIRKSIPLIKHHMNGVSQDLCALDGQLGDGDLGITLSKAFNRLYEISNDLPDDLGQTFIMAAQAISKVSSSSFGTLMAVSCLAISKRLKDHTEIPWVDVPDLLILARDTISQRGKATLGQKTVIDAIDAAAQAMAGHHDPGLMLAEALAGVRTAIDTMRDKPAQIGRARIFSEKSAGLDDPGMKAFEEMLVALIGN